MRGRGISWSALAAVAVVVASVAACVAGPPAAGALPANRSYERVSPVEMNGESPATAVPAPDGEAVDYQSGAFGEALAGGWNFYQARRTSTGWQTRALTPKNVVQSRHLTEAAVMFFTPDLSQTIFTTGQPWSVEDQGEQALDLYEESPQGTLTWISRGTQGATQTGSATFAGATPDGSQILFDSPDSLLPQVPQQEVDSYSAPQFLYDRDVATGQTTVVDVGNNGEVLPEGAVLGNGTALAKGGPPISDSQPADEYGTTTNAISADGSKIFFESPMPAGFYGYRMRPVSEQAIHLYMRKDNSVTVALDNPSFVGGAGARYMGASESGEDVFFLSDEGLAGSSFTDPELYLYNTVSEKLTLVSGAPEGEPPVDGAVVGVSAVANDGSHVYYVAEGVLAPNANSAGQTATTGEPNFYVYDTITHRNTFIGRLAPKDLEYGEGLGRMVSYLDVARPAVPTPNGEVLVFGSFGHLIGESSSGTSQIYRYDAGSGELLCISCGPTATGDAKLDVSEEGPGGSIGGGSYDPPDQSAPMSADGEQVFFETESTLLPEDRNGTAPPFKVSLFGEEVSIPDDMDIYEWDRGELALITAGEPGLSSLQSVTPSGDDVFFDTNVDMEDDLASTTGEVVLYDARVGGGFPTPSGTEVAPCESGASCRGSTSGLPTFVTPGTLAPNPVTNVVPSPSTIPTAKAKPKPKLKRKATSKPKKKTKAKAKPRRRAKSSTVRHPGDRGGRTR